MLLRMRGLAIVATLTLGLGIAATTTMFSVVYAALLRPLPFDHPDELAMLYVMRTTPQDGTRRVTHIAEIVGGDHRHHPRRA